MVEKGYRMELPEGCPQDIFNIMNDCWKLDPKERPDFKHLRFKLENIRSQTL